MRRNDFYQSIESNLPWIPKTFSKLEKKLRTFDMRQPMTLMADMENEVNKVAERIQRRPRPVMKGLMFLAKHPYFKKAMVNTMQICIRKVDNQIATDTRGAQLIRLINDIDAEVPFRSWLVLQEHIDFRLLFRPLCLAGTSLDEAQNLDGEAKASVLIEALGKTCEVLYKPYLMALWQLTCLRKGKRPTQPGFGSLVIELSSRLSDFPGLVDPDARWMRNSARHERWEPIPNEEAIVMWDDNTPRTKITFPELEKKVMDLYQVAGITFPSVAQRYLFQNILVDSGLWDVLGKKLPAIVELIKADGSTEADIDKLIEPELAPVKEKFVPLITFVECNFPTAVNNGVGAPVR